MYGQGGWWGGGAGEIVRVGRNQWQELPANVVRLMADAIAGCLAEIVGKNSVVGLFAPLGGMSLLPLLVHHAAIERGAAVLRLGTDNLDRQLWLADSLGVTILLCGRATRQYLAAGSSRLAGLPWIQCGVLPQALSRLNEEGCVRTILEHEAAAAVFVPDDGRLFCPGFECVSGDDGQLRLVPSWPSQPVDPGLEAAVDPDGRFMITGRCEQGPRVPDRIAAVCDRHGVRVADGRLDLDSMAMVELLVALEEEFSFSAPVEEIDRRLFDSPESLAVFVRRWMAGGDGE